jgi:hypothetical protein
MTVPSPLTHVLSHRILAKDSNTPFGDVVIISLGFVLVFVGTLPMGYFNLDDNIWVQIGTTLPRRVCVVCMYAFWPQGIYILGSWCHTGACAIMFAIVLGVWMVDFFMLGLSLGRIDVVGSNQRFVRL